MRGDGDCSKQAAGALAAKMALHGFQWVAGENVANCRSRLPSGILNATRFRAAEGTYLLPQLPIINGGFAKTPNHARHRDRTILTLGAVRLRVCSIIKRFLNVCIEQLAACSG
jgi:hypothetical protein